MTELFTGLWEPELAFFRCALLAGLLAAPAAGVVGTMVVTRRITSLAGASSHAALGGVGLALYFSRVWQWTWFTPLVGAVIGALSAALVVGIISLRAHEREDTVIGMVWAVGMSVGLLFLNYTPGYVDWQGYLFGNILLLNGTDLLLLAILDVLVIVPTLLGYPLILAASFDALYAKLRGIPTTALHLVLLGFTALTIVIMINLAGIILVIALLTLPAATAGCFTRHLWSMMAAASGLCWSFIWGGLLLSFIFDLPSGPAIAVFSGAVYLVALAVSRRRRRS